MGISLNVLRQLEPKELLSSLNQLNFHMNAEVNTNNTLKEVGYRRTATNLLIRKIIIEIITDSSEIRKEIVGKKSEKNFKLSLVRETPLKKLEVTRIVQIASRTLAKLSISHPHLDLTLNNYTLRDCVLDLIFSDFPLFLDSLKNNFSQQNEVNEIPSLSYFFRLISTVLASSKESIKEKIHLFPENCKKIRNFLIHFPLYGVAIGKITPSLDEDAIYDYQICDAKSLKNVKYIIKIFQHFMNEWKISNTEWINDLQFHLKEFKFSNAKNKEKIATVLSFAEKLNLELDRFKLIHEQVQQAETPQKIIKTLWSYDKTLQEVYDNYNLALYDIFCDLNIWCFGDVELNNKLNDLTVKEKNLRNKQQDNEEENDYLPYETVLNFHNKFEESGYTFCILSSSLVRYLTDQQNLNEEIEAYANFEASEEDDWEEWRETNSSDDERKKEFWELSVEQIENEINHSSSLKKKRKTQPLISKKKSKKHKIPPSLKPLQDKISSSATQQLQEPADNRQIKMQLSPLRTGLIKKYSCSPPNKRKRRSRRAHNKKKIEPVSKETLFQFPTSEKEKLTEQLIQNPLASLISQIQLSLKDYEKESSLHLTKYQPRTNFFSNESIDAFNNIANHEINIHTGMQQYIQAIKNQEYMLLGTIMPSVLFYLYIQHEQLLRLLRLKNFPYLLDNHDLALTTQTIEIDNLLSESSKKCLKDMALVTYWFRYPNNITLSLKRNAIDKLPLALKLILKSQHFTLDMHISEEKIKKTITCFISFFRRNIELKNELLSLVTLNKNITLENSKHSLLEYLENFEKMFKSELITISRPTLIFRKDLKKQIKVLQTVIKRIEVCKQSDKDSWPQELTSYLQDAQLHVNHLIQNIRSYAWNSEKNNYAWIYRNFMIRFQITLELFYLIRASSTCDIDFTQLENPHDLMQFHKEIFRDSEEMNPEYFSFYKSFQYPSTRPLTEKASQFFNYQRALQEQITNCNHDFTLTNSHCIKLYDEQMKELIHRGVKLINAHSQICVNFLKSQQSYLQNNNLA